MAPKYRILLLFVISMIVTWFVFRPILKIAQQKGIVDNPDARKLQRVPIPVLGGVAVFFGIVVGLCFFKTMLSFTSLFAVLTAMIVMLYLGTIDDILNLSPFLRLGIEVVVVTLLIYGTHYSMCNFQGLWGIDQLPIIFSVPLSIVTMVGIINAINMIDGVDGLVSGFCIVACTLFGVIFFCEHEYSFAALAAVTVGALIPFFLHNVFGIKSKMFMGDGGTMMLGIVMSSFVIALCKYRIEYNFLLNHQFGVLAFSLAVLAVPIFDTLRVMIYRVLHGHSPFFPDKNHLHHIFIEFGFSHIGTTMSEIVLELFVVAVWALVWSAGAPVDIQLYCVIAASLLVTFGVAAFLKRELKRKSLCSRAIRVLASGTHIEWDGFWLKIQNFVDGKSAVVALLLVLPIFASCSMFETAVEEEEAGYGPDGLYYTPNPTCIAIFGDIQVYTENEELVQNYVNSLQWLKDRQLRDADISCILHTGDVANTNMGHQWRRFQSNTSIVSDCIPYYTSTGNHDYDWNAEEVITDRNSSGLNQHYDFPYLAKNLLAAYEEGKLDNAVFSNRFAGQNMDIMMLEFAPREDVLKWAGEYLAAHKDTRHILVTHEFLWRDGTLFTDKPYSERQFRDLSASSPYEIWSRLVAPNDNIACVLCGHVSNFVRVVELTSMKGKVPAVEFNLQDEKDGGDGWIMLWDAKNPDDSVSVSIYNTVSGKYYQNRPVYAKFKFR